MALDMSLLYYFATFVIGFILGRITMAIQIAYMKDLINKKKKTLLKSKSLQKQKTLKKKK